MDGVDGIPNGSRPQRNGSDGIEMDQRREREVAPPTSHEEPSKPSNIRPSPLKQNITGALKRSQRRGSTQDDGSETESESDTRQFPEKSGNHDDSKRRKDSNETIDQQPVYTKKDSEVKRAGSVLSSLLARPGIPVENLNSSEVNGHPFPTRYENEKILNNQPPLTRTGQEPSMLKEDHQQNDMRLPALNVGSNNQPGLFMRQMNAVPAPHSQVPPTQEPYITRGASINAMPQSIPDISNRPRPDINMGNHWQQPPSRPTTIEGHGLDRSSSPPRQYEANKNPHMAVAREDYDYPTYQPPESLVGQRIAKTFAGHGRFVGQVVKYNAQTELFTVVYADGDTEELTRESTMNLLIEDKRVHQTKPRDTVRKVQPMEQAPIHPANTMANNPRLAISERELELLNTLFEKHAWPILSENGWKSEVHGTTYYFYPSWSGKNTRQPEYFNSVVDIMKYMSLHSELLRMCFPVDVHSTILSIFDPSRGMNGPPKRALDENTQQASLKRIKAESPHHLTNRPSAMPVAPRHMEQQPYHAENGHPAYHEMYSNEFPRRHLPDQATAVRYARHDDEALKHVGARGYSPSAQKPPSPSAHRMHLNRNPNMVREDAYESQRAVPGHRPDYDLARQRPPSSYQGNTPSSHSPRSLPDPSVRTPQLQPHFAQPSHDGRLIPGQQPPAMHHNPMMYNRNDLAPPRYAAPQARPPQRAGMISMSDLDKSSLPSGQNPRSLPDASRLRIFSNEHPTPAPYTRPREWDDRYAPSEQHPPPFRRDIPAMGQDRSYPSERYAPPAQAEGYYEHQNAGQPQRVYLGRGDLSYPPRTGDIPPSNANPDRTHEYQYNRRL